MFDNPYTHPDRPSRPVPPMPRPCPAARPPRRARGLALAAGLAVPLLVLAGLAAPAAGSGPLGPGSYSSYNSGRLSVVFPSPTPAVELLQDANRSIAAALILENVVEFQPTNGDHPLVVRAASPSANGSFQQLSANSGTDSFGLSLNGSLPVERVSVPLWNTPLALPSNASAAPVPSTASLVVSYTLLNVSSAAEGLALSWSIRNWPWASSSDLLGIDMRFVVPNATSFGACGGSEGELPLNGTVAANQCAGPTLSPGAIEWNSSAIGSVAGTEQGGLAAALSWDPAATIPGHGPVPVTAAAYYTGASEMQVTIAARAAGSDNVTESARLLLHAPLVSFPLPALLRGDLLAYGGALLLSGIAVAGGLVAYRRRERRLIAAL